MRLRPRDDPKWTTVLTHTNQERVAAAREMEDRLIRAAKANKKQEDLQGLCNILKAAGGEFYANVEECPEVVELRLL